MCASKNVGRKSQHQQTYNTGMVRRAFSILKMLKGDFVRPGILPSEDSFTLSGNMVVIYNVAQTTDILVTVIYILVLQSIGMPPVPFVTNAIHQINPAVIKAVFCLSLYSILYSAHYRKKK